MREPTIDLNADVAEGADDAALYSIVTSVNIACGAHAGDDETMRDAVARAREHGVAIGAHPGYPDRDSMGRRALAIPPQEIARLMVEQIAALDRIVSRAGLRIRHVKPHGALYNQAAADAAIARAIASAVAAFDPALTLVGLAGSEMLAAGRAAGLEVAGEAFADRGYRADGTLLPRDEPGALIQDPVRAAAQAVALARGEPVPAGDGSVVVEADTVCLHGDTPGAVRNAVSVRAALEAAGIKVAPL
ncbi:MAG TPA: 5-oxoprolinase subunit PxpA [Actinomycetota bacterium]|nr:5-oxoprolinase subunit PxpA [Actinomycetota bacterium]